MWFASKPDHQENQMLGDPVPFPALWTPTSEQLNEL